MKLLESKKGQMAMSGMPSAVLGIILIIGGGLSLFGEMLFGLVLPPIPVMILEILIAVGGILLLIDGIKGVGPNKTNPLIPKKVNVGLGVLVLIMGALLLLMRFAVIPQLAAVPTIVLHAIMLLAGVILLLDALLGAKNMSY